MILNHLWGLYAHPLEEWQTIDNRHENVKYSLSHIALIALIPSLMGYYSSVYLGWSIGTGDNVYLTHESAVLIGVAMYCGSNPWGFCTRLSCPLDGSNVRRKTYLYSNA